MTIQTVLPGRWMLRLLADAHQLNMPVPMVSKHERRGSTVSAGAPELNGAQGPPH